MIGGDLLKASSFLYFLRLLIVPPFLLSRIQLKNENLESKWCFEGYSIFLVC